MVHDVNLTKLFMFQLRQQQDILPLSKLEVKLRDLIEQLYPPVGSRGSRGSRGFTRLKAVQELSNLQNDEADFILIEKLKSGDEDRFVRRSLAAALGYVKGKTNITKSREGLIQILSNDKDVSVLEDAIKSLGKIGDHGTLKSLAEAKIKYRNDGKIIAVIDNAVKEIQAREPESKAEPICFKPVSSSASAIFSDQASLSSAANMTRYMSTTGNGDLETQRQEREYLEAKGMLENIKCWQNLHHDCGASHHNDGAGHHDDGAGHHDDGLDHH